MDRVHVLDHPLVRHHLTYLRDITTSPELFRLTIHRLASMLFAQAAVDLELKTLSVQSPLGPADGHRLSERVGIIPILRAGLAMVQAGLELIPDAEVWHLGLYRNEQTLQPVVYYNKLPERHPVDVAFILDPMLATGGSAGQAVAVVRQWGAERIKLLAIIASPTGVKEMLERFPTIDIYLCAIDSHLNDRGYIVPGLGDAGDRTFNAVAR